MKLSVLTRKKKNERLSLVHIAGSVPEVKKEAAQKFVDAVMDAAYKGAHYLSAFCPSSLNAYQALSGSAICWSL